MVEKLLTISIRIAAIKSNLSIVLIRKAKVIPLSQYF